MKDLQKLAKECMSELDAIGVEYGNVIEFKINTRAKSRWGQCRRIIGNTYSINITNELLRDDLSDRPCKETIFHELIHTCKGCMNHGYEWQRIADLVNDCYGYNIKRATSSEEKGVEMVKVYKYCFKCTNCGSVVKRNRASDFTRNYKRYGCGKCHKYNTFEEFAF